MDRSPKFKASRRNGIVSTETGSDRGAVPAQPSTPIAGVGSGKDRVTLEECDPRCDEARYCLFQYYEELNRRFKCGFDVSLSRDPDASDMVRPRGAFILARLEGAAIGAVGLKGSGNGDAEIKRLWVAPRARGLGVGRRLMAAAENAARQLSFECLRLDTNSVLQEAVNLYRKNGWKEIERFNDDPYPDIFFEKRL